MCEIRGKLVAWLDRELLAEEAREVEYHVERCEECRRWVAKYGQVSQAFDAYCEALMAAKTRKRVLRWVPVLASALVAAVVLFLLFLRAHVEPRPVVGPTVEASVRAPEHHAAEPAARKMIVHRRHVTSRVPEYGAKVQPMDGAIEIAIPGEAMFPLGAVPDGINFMADLRIAPDGSVKQVRLRQ